MEQSEGSVMIEEFAYVRRVLMREFLGLHHIGNSALAIFPKFARCWHGLLRMPEVGRLGT